MLAEIINQPLSPPSESQTAIKYDAVAEEAGIILPPGVTLGEVFAQLKPNHELIMRAYYGMFPYEQRHTKEDIARRTGFSGTIIHDALRRAPGQIQEYAALVADGSKEAAVSMEVVARGMRQTSLSEKSQDILRALRGLPPYTRPVMIRDLCDKYGVATKTIYLIEKRALLEIRGDYAALEKIDPSAKYQDIAERIRVFRAIELGWLSLGLLGLRDPATREEAAEMVFQGHKRAITARKRRREATPTRIDIGGQRGGDEKTQEFMVAAREYDPVRDEIEGAPRIIQALTSMALRLDESDVQTLHKLAAEGKAQEEQFVEDNLKLVFFMAVRSRGRFLDLITDGYEGLLHAVRKYDVKLGYKFSTYATQWIAAYTRESFYKNLASRIGRNVARAKEVIETMRIETKLLQARQSATPDNIAAVMMKKKSRQTVITPERVQENMLLYQGHLLRDDLEAPHPQLKIAEAADIGGRTVSMREAMGNDQSTPLQGAWEQIVGMAELSDDQMALLAIVLGSEDMGEAIDVIVQKYGISKIVAKNRIKKVFGTITASPEAMTHLMRYLKKEKEN